MKRERREDSGQRCTGSRKEGDPILEMETHFDEVRSENNAFGRPDIGNLRRTIDALSRLLEYCRCTVSDRLS